MGSLDKVYRRGSIFIRAARVVRTKLAKRASDHLPLVIDFHLSELHLAAHEEKRHHEPARNGQS
jgi:hypothetical protein